MGDRPLFLSLLERLRVLAALVAIAAALLTATVHPVRAETADINAAARSVVRVVIVLRDNSGYDVIGHGTGFAVSPKLIVTNAHVLAPLIEDPRLRLGVVPAQGRSGYFARIVRVANSVDLAIIELTEDASLPVATLYSGSVDDGADVYAVGYPANVDEALGLGLSGLVSPQAPIKTRGQVSGGRTSSQYDTILHTAPIGVGNSGGPLLDSCGRVVGVNSFGTISDNGSDSEFYFAVSMRELAPFLRNAGINARTSAQPCRSIADFDAEESARALREAAEERARANAAAAERSLSAERAARRAELLAIDERETQMALAMVLLMLFVMGAGSSWQMFEREKREQGAGAMIFAFICLAGAIAAWVTRPSVAQVEQRGDEAKRAALTVKETPNPPSPRYDAGRFVCRIVPERSRVTVSDTSPVALAWSEDGCVNERTQYGLSAGRWSRILVPGSEQTISINRYDPSSRTLTTDRYFVDLKTMASARSARSQYQAPACGAGEDAAREFGESQDAIRALLPDAPNERLTYRCEPEASGAQDTPQPD